MPCIGVDAGMSDLCPMKKSYQGCESQRRLFATQKGQSFQYSNQRSCRALHYTSLRFLGQERGLLGNVVLSKFSLARTCFAYALDKSTRFFDLTLP